MEQKKFAIRIEEICARTVIVEAESLDDAVSKVEDAYERNAVELSPCDDYDETIIEASGCFEGGLVPEGYDVSHFEHL